MTTAQLLDQLAPYTKEEMRCANVKRRHKINLRIRLLMEIQKMQRDGLRNDDILLMYDKDRTAFAMD